MLTVPVARGRTGVSVSGGTAVLGVPMVAGGIRERLRLRREAAEADAPPRARPGLVAPVLLALFFVLVVIIVVKIGGGEDKKSGSAENVGGSGDTDASASASASPEGPPVAPPGSIEGAVKSRVALAVYKQPEARGKTVLSADHGVKVMVVCHIDGQTQYTQGRPDPTWARIIVSGKQGYVPVGQLETGGVVRQQVPACG
ncbi:hypothetical protein [Yinghuangia seranimata]|uniref:hypothetical protein n=1 Tax=Yinghuangia seranimata TaxID=408067 RepID=UPI00248D36C2|nr:hypothetical protein [Yinghuangia seranimata]MDI2129735.1 hypothetical protein [Yinghuangia seranimata]